MHLLVSQLIGIWKLLYINVTVPNPDTIYYGPNTVGRIIITPELYFNAMITDYDQAVLPNDTTWAHASIAQRAAIARPMVTYEGMFTTNLVGNDTYTHVAVENSLNPSWVGTDQVRRASLEEKGGKSILTLVPLKDGTLVNETLVWEKLEFPAGAVF